MRILIIDNYDSFTYNLVQRIGELTLQPDGSTAHIAVHRNDQITTAHAESLDPTHIVISPGPCTPNEAGVSSDIIHHFAARVPILGVCLGHQCIGALNGLTVQRHTVVMHGKTSPVHHDNAGVFKHIPNPFTATRYHSLVVTADDETLDELAHPQHGSWTLSAWAFEHTTGERVIMGLRKRGSPSEAPVEGVQFHPESFLTAHGPRILANFLELPWPTGVWTTRALDTDPLHDPEPASTPTPTATPSPAAAT